jgi:hypothetical protein
MTIGWVATGRVPTMGRVMDHLDDATIGWIGRQRVFFVASAPLDGGHVNLSPKGLDSFRVLGPTSVAYLDLTGSGAETIAHLRENGRITVMFAAFEGPPRIVRLYGSGTVTVPTDGRFTELAGHFDERRGTRSIITVDIERVQDSCGYGVPRMDFVEDRSRLGAWVDQRSDDEIAEYWAERNATSIDGLPAVDT